MKKMTFAFACASAVAAFASAPDPVISSINFEDYTVPFTGLSLAGDDGSVVAATASRWLYEGTGDDGSTVKAYDPAITDNANYLELSTEGGTLWRSINTLASTTELGTAQEVSAETGLYVDTMVQFTPTEDGGAPELGDDDKLAIWLNVDSTGTTNLMVKSSFYYAQDAETVVHSNRCYKLSGTYEAGAWYRLTVKAVKSLTGTVGQEAGIYLPGFEISVDGQVLTTDEQVCDAGALSYLTTDEVEGEEVEPYLDAVAAAKLTGKTFVPSIAGYQSADVSALQAVGFKGSGAIDNLQFTTEDPNADPEGDFEVNWGSEGVQAVWGDTPPTAAELAAIKAWAVANSLSADDVAGENGAAAYLLGLTEVPEEMPELKITAIEQAETGWTITIACDAQADLSKINGSLVVKTAAELGGTWTAQTIEPTFTEDDGATITTITVPAGDAKFMKAAIGKPVAAPAAE